MSSSPGAGADRSPADVDPSRVPTEDGDASAIRAEDFERLVHEAMPLRFSYSFRIEELHRGRCRMRLHFDEGQLRPGGTIAGPVMFTLADTVFYAMAMSVVGLEPLTVTTDLGLHFLRKPGRADLIGVGKLHKSRGRLLVGEVVIYSEGDDEPVAVAHGSYAVPSRSLPRQAGTTDKGDAADGADEETSSQGGGPGA